MRGRFLPPSFMCCAPAASVRHCHKSLAWPVLYTSIFSQRHQAGFFLRIGQAGLAEYDEMEGIDWQWQSIDGAIGKAPRGRKCVGPNPADRGKKGASGA